MTLLFAVLGLATMGVVAGLVLGAIQAFRRRSFGVGAANILLAAVALGAVAAGVAYLRSTP